MSFFVCHSRRESAVPTFPRYSPGLSYDPELAYSLYGLAFDLFHRKLGQGDLPILSAASTESCH
jgi:hypothetical protein